MIGIPPLERVMGVGRQQQHSALDTLAAKSRLRNGATSMETQHVRADWMKKIRRICYNVLS